MTSSVSVPSAVAKSIRSRWPDVGVAWAQEVEAELSALCERYAAHPYQALPARYSFVVMARAAIGDLVLRVTPDPEASNQAKAARLLAGSGAGPRVHEVLRTSAGLWTVMDRVVPGIPLNAATSSGISIQDVASPFGAMAKSAPIATELPSITGWLCDRLNSDLLVDIPPGKTVAPRRERQRANALLCELAAEEALGAMCHGDAHPGNLLVSDSDRRVQLIDPRGMQGSVAYDIGVLSLKISGYRQDSAAVLACQLAELAGVDPQEAAVWVEIADAARV